MGKFRIPVTPTSSTRSIRFPDSLIEEVENTIKDKPTNFNAFVVAATKHALDELKETEDDDNLILDKITRK